MRTFNLLFFGDSLKRFVESLDYFVVAYDFVYKVATYESTFITMQVMTFGLIFIIWFEYTIPICMICFAMLSMSNKYHKK